MIEYGIFAFIVSVFIGFLLRYIYDKFFKKIYHKYKQSDPMIITSKTQLINTLPECMPSPQEIAKQMRINADIIQVKITDTGSFPPHIYMIIEHNNHKNFYENIGKYLKEGPVERLPYLTDEEYKICIATDELWEIQWYPHNPISFHYICGPTFQSCLDKIKNGKWD